MRRLVPQILVALAVLGQLSTAPPGAAAPTSTFIVDLSARVDAGRYARSMAAEYGGTAAFIYDHALGGFAFVGSDAAAARLARDRRVTGVERDLVYRAVDDPPTDISHLNRTDVPEAHAAGYDGDGVTIAIIDTGIDRTHPVFGDHDNILPGGKSCVGGGTNDGEGHGTRTASNAVGHIGVAHLAKAVAVKVFPGASLYTTVSRIVCGLNWVAKRNTDDPGTIDVVNLSVAGPGSRAMRRAVGDVLAGGAIVVAASGNTGATQPLFPARYDGVIAASALSGGTKMATFSNDGADVTAPGVNIKSAENGGGYSRASGTSRAAPQVAGTIAIILGEGVLPADAYDVLRTSGFCPNGDVNADGGTCSGNGNWAHDADEPEPLINAYCAGALVDPLNTDSDCGE